MDCEWSSSIPKRCLNYKEMLSCLESQDVRRCPLKTLLIMFLVVLWCRTIVCAVQSLLCNFYNSLKLHGLRCTQKPLMWPPKVCKKPNLLYLKKWKIHRTKFTTQKCANWAQLQPVANTHWCIVKLANKCRKHKTYATLVKKHFIAEHRNDRLNNIF